MEKTYKLIISKDGITRLKAIIVPESKLTNSHKEVLLETLVSHWNNTPEDVRNTFMHDIFTRLKQVEHGNK